VKIPGRYGLQVDWEGPRWEVVVALGGLRGGRAETLVEKVTELGAWSLRPLLTNRSRTIGERLSDLAAHHCAVPAIE